MGGYADPPTYGYRSDTRLAANAPYGTYPGKRNHTSAILRARYGAQNEDESSYPLLLHSTTNAYETHWQPPVNPAMMMILPTDAAGKTSLAGGDATLRRSSSPLRRGGSPQRQVRAASPQKGILRRRGSPAACTARPNMFDCPAATSASTLALVGRCEQKGSPENGPFCGANGFASTGNASTKKTYNNGKFASSANCESFEEKTGKRGKKCRFCAEILRTAIVEFLALTFIIFLHYHIHFVFGAGKTNSDNQLLQIVIFALIDTMPIVALFTVFPTVHLNPAITVAHLSSSLIPFYICLVILCAQIFACCFCAFAIFFYLNYDARSSVELPGITSSNLGLEGGDSARDVYQLVFSQCLGTALVAICHLSLTKIHWGKSRQVSNSHSANIVGIFAALWLSSFLSLMRSNVSWNPAVALVAVLQRLASDTVASGHFAPWESAAIWRNYYIFWTGPMIGALFACFFYRVAFTPEDGRKIHNLVSEKSKIYK